MPTHLDMQFDLGRSVQAVRSTPGAPFRTLILADLLGAVQAGPLASRSIHRVDIDNFDTLLSGLAPQLELGEAGTLEITDLDDFHPDTLYRRLGVFKPLRELHSRLRDPNRAAAAMAELNAVSTGDQAPPEPPSRPSGSPFEQLLGGRPTRPRTQPVGVERLLEQVVKPHVITTGDVGPYLQFVDQALAELMGGLLHQPDFQALEANWRGLWWLLTNLSDAPELQVHVLPVSREELAGDLFAVGTDLARSALYRRLIETDSAAPDYARWSLVAGLYDFGASEEDIRLLAGLATLTGVAGAALLAGARPDLAGCDAVNGLSDPDGWRPLPEAVESRWQALRRSAVGDRIALLLPRLLLRQPYGPRSDPIDSFDYEELPSPCHEHLLWANPALGAIQGLGQAFLAEEWNLDPASPMDIEDLPAWHYHQDGETRLQPCAEVLLGERAAAALVNRGLTPLLSYRDRNAVRLPGLTALSGDVLAGAWR